MFECTDPECSLFMSVKFQAVLSDSESLLKEMKQQSCSDLFGLKLAHFQSKSASNTYKGYDIFV
jgi:hypothetical protein